MVRNIFKEKAVSPENLLGVLLPRPEGILESWRKGEKKGARGKLKYFCEVTPGGRYERNTSMGKHTPFPPQEIRGEKKRVLRVQPEIGVENLGGSQ